MDRTSATRRKPDFTFIQRRRSLEPKCRRTDDLYGSGLETNPMTQRDKVLALNLREATVRYETFPKESNPVEKTSLWASNGFFHNEKGYAECFCCHIYIPNWIKLKDPGRIHLERYPDCRFRKGEDTGNIPFNCRPLSPSVCSSSDEDGLFPTFAHSSATNVTPQGPIAPPSYHTPPHTPQREKRQSVVTRSETSREMNHEGTLV